MFFTKPNKMDRFSLVKQQMMRSSNSRWKGPRLSFKPVTLRVWGNTFNHLAALKHNHHIENQVNSGSMTKSGSVATNLFLNILANSIFEFIQCFCFLWERIFCLYRNTTEFIQTSPFRTGKTLFRRIMSKPPSSPLSYRDRIISQIRFSIPV